MNLYSFVFLDAGRIRQAEFDDVLDALDYARLLSENAEIEIWEENCFVARVRKNDAAPEVTDQLGG